MIDRNPSNSNHKPMQIKQNRVPITTCFEQPTPGINENFRLVTTTQVSSSISLRIPLLIHQPNPTLLNINIFSMPFNLCDPNPLSAPGTNHVPGKSDQITILG